MNKYVALNQKLHRLDVLAGRYLSRNLAQRGLEDLDGRSGNIILYLDEHEGEELYQRDVEKEFGLSRATASRALTLMDRHGLVVRGSVSHDTRLKKVTLTEKSREYANLMHQNAEVMVRHLLTGFTEEEIDQFLGYIGRLENNMKNAYA